MAGAETMTLTPDQRKLARTALGLPNYGDRGEGQSYRNYFSAPPTGASFDAWSGMVAAGCAKLDRVSEHTQLHYFSLTEVGAGLALNPGETLDPEDFPASPTQGDA